MKTFKIIANWSSGALWAMLVICIGMAGCEFDPPSNINITDDTNISGYLRQNPDEFSSLSHILEISNTEGFLGTYGTYTFFAPDNEAVEGYLQENGLSMDGLTEEDAKDIVRYHLLTDTISTAGFTDGKLPIATEYGKYLITGAEYEDGETFIRVNRQANITESNVKLGNGILHEIDNVLSPPTKTMAQWLEENQQYSIFSQALKETGWYDILNQEEEGQWYTVLAESDETLAEAGYESYQALEDRYSNTGDPTNPSDSLNLFVSYHILPDIKYIADLVTATAHETEAPQEVVTIKLNGTEVLVNDDVFFGVHEPGSPIIREASDFSVTNGVVHSVEDHFGIKLRAPVPVYWDVADQAELRQMTTVFRVPGAPKYTFKLGELSKMSWEGNYVDNEVVYNPPALNEQYFVNGDFIDFGVASNRLTKLHITTPVLVKGRYKLWVCYRARGSYGTQAKVTLNDEDIPGSRLLDTREYFPAGLDDVDEAEARGWKKYTALTNSRNWVGRLIGTLDVQTTGEQTISFERVAGGTDGFWMDMLHFIPDDMEQQWPKFNIDGEMVYPED
ncbi:fasciclin domain-containing protein [Echinicola soli]|uniref:Fasciclin domain-containing protein n=1 Tax=Echinicola soli TaxID=2591634 RepID=A0A514CGL3_9BACT|nr:fasciclin domain-containing protein [Echinicola soli]QDH78961.1 fasciclin domain-containing protein [Echinicola soli]